MEALNLSSKSHVTPSATEPPAVKPIKVKVPGDFLLGPIFAATEQKAGREVIVGQRQYQIGGFDPLRIRKPVALDVRHARVLFTILSFWHQFEYSGDVSFSLNKFCLRYANSNGGRYARDMIRLFDQLRNTYIRMTDSETGQVEQFRFLKDVRHYNRAPRRRDAQLAYSPQQELWIDGCVLSPEFVAILGRVSELRHIRLDVLNSIRSPLAQAIYLYIPSRAHHHDEANPFEITLTTLLKQVGFPRPRYPSQRRQIFEQHKKEGRSILQQLHGLETLTGHFKVGLTETKSGDDWKLQAWVVNDLPVRKPEIGESKLMGAYRESGRPIEWMLEALKNPIPLNDYEIDLLKAAKVEVEKNLRFFIKAKTILKEPRFASLLAEAKNDEMEGRKATKNPTARLIYRIESTIREPIGRPTFEPGNARFNARASQSSKELLPRQQR